jgi:alpha-tubulin suppressor-like RCC1 family protein
MLTKHTLTRRVVPAVATVLLSAAFVTASARADQNEGIPTVSAAAEATIAVGGLHTCGVLNSGQVQCWGSNDQGQLGNGTVITSTNPVTVPGISTATAITAGNTHTCSLLADTTVRCWGLAANGQVGDGTFGATSGDLKQQPQRRTPVTVVKDSTNVALSGVASIAAGGFHTCAAMTDGTVRCWGDDGMGQLGDGKPGARSAFPVTVANLSNVTAVSLGEFDSCALKSDGTMWCWGHNGFGELGDGTTTNRSVPVKVAGLPDPTVNPVVALTTGYGNTCALLQDNTAKCWGENNFGQLGYDTPHQNGDATKPMVPSLTPQTVQGATGPMPLPPTPQPHADQQNIVAISAGQFHTCALVSAGTIRCWGEGGRGQLGEDPNPFARGINDSTYAVDVQGLSGSATAVTAGGFHSCAAIAGTMQCWGYNFYGQLGSSAPQSTVPVQVTALSGATQVSAGTAFACALVNADTKNKPVCWGDNSTGELGAGMTDAKSSIRTAVSGIPSASALDAGNGFACAIPAGSNTPQCWGHNLDGELGNGTTVDSSTPVTVSGLTTAAGINAGGASDGTERGVTCAATTDQKVSCWGRNANGELGNNTTTDSSTPVAVQNNTNPDFTTDPTLAVLTGVTSVVTGGSHACALATDTTVWCWGANGNGELGDNTTTDRSYGVHVQKDDSDTSNDNPLTGVVALAAGTSYTCALLNTGEVRCWGADSEGQLGDGGGSDSSKPVGVSGIDGSDNDHAAQAITAGDNHACAVLDNGALVCWGDNGDGQLGDGSTSGSATPTQVANMGPTDSSVPAQFLPIIRSISASRNNTCAVLVDTSVYCWGDNSRDQLGDGIGASSVAPRTANLAGTLGP